MTKRIICIILTILILLATTGCRTTGDTLSNNSEQSSMINDGETVNNDTVFEENDIANSETQNESSSTSTTNSNTSSNKNTSQSNVSSIPSTQDSPSNNTSSNNSDSNQITDLVIRNNEIIYEDGPEITKEYLYPSKDTIYFKNDGSKTYENIYAKLDVTTATQGYLLVTYKDPWADKIHITLDETASDSGMFQKIHHFYYNKGDIRSNEPIAIALPKTDAIYYIVISSEINGNESIKFELNLGQIVIDGHFSYQEMIPTEEQMKLTQVSSGVYTNKYVKIDTNTVSKGYIEVEYLDTKAYDISVSLVSNKKTQQGRLGMADFKANKQSGYKIKAAITYGNAEYRVVVMSTMKNESTGVERYSKKADLTLNLTNVPETLPFLLSTGEVLYNSDMMFIKKASEIAATCKDDFEKVSKIYDWLTQYIQYQIEEETFQGEYICDLNKIYTRKTGVCYDYAVVLAAMLRSQGIPCKVLFGQYANTTTGYGHVWNEIYIAKSGSFTTNELSITGNKWCRLDPTLSNVNSGQYAIDFMNNDTNYIARACY